MIKGMLDWIITGTVIVTLIGFVLYLVGLFSLPTQRRPRTPTYDRFGNLIGEEENPDYHENPGEDEE